MKRWLGILAAVFLVTALTAAGAGTHDRHGRNVTTRGHNIERCSDLEVQFDDWELRAVKIRGRLRNPQSLPWKCRR